MTQHQQVLRFDVADVGKDAGVIATHDTGAGDSDLEDGLVLGHRISS